MCVIDGMCMSYPVMCVCVSAIMVYIIRRRVDYIFESFAVYVDSVLGPSLGTKRRSRRG